MISPTPTLISTITTLLLASHLADATTTYGCWSEQSRLFREDCLKAASSLILEQTGTDNQAWVPNYIIQYKSGSCTAILKATYGVVVPALSLMSSFDQLGSRCQHGYFYYDSGYIDAELQGVAGYRKRDEIANQTAESGLGESGFGGHGGEEWTIQEDIFNMFENVTSTQLRQRRQSRPILSLPAKRSEPGVYFRTGSANGLYMNLYRGTRNIVAGLVANHYDLVSELGTRVADTVDDALTNTGNHIVNTGYTISSGSTVHSVTAAIQLNGVYSSWQCMFNAYGDGGALAVELVQDAIADFFRSGYTNAVYHVDNYEGIAIFSFIINGVVGQVNALPSS